MHQPFRRQTPHGHHGNEDRIVRKSAHATLAIGFIVWRLASPNMQVFEDQIVKIADTTEARMLNPLEYVKQVHIDEGPAICRGIGINKQLASAPRHDRESTEFALLEKIVGIGEIDAVFELSIHLGNQVVPAVSPDHHIIVGQNYYVAARFLQAGGVVGPHGRRWPDDSDDGEIGAIQLVASNIIFVDIQNDFDSFKLRSCLCNTPEEPLHQRRASTRG